MNAGTYKMECYGARGENGHGRSKGGYGGYTCGTIQLTQDTQLYLYIGQVGQDGDTRRASFNGGAIGGGDNYYGTAKIDYNVGLGANGGSNFIDESYFALDRESKSGINDGNGYIIITKLTNES